MRQQPKIRFTKQGLADSQAELQKLQDSRPDAVKELSVARAMGDLSENAAYTAARRKLSNLDSRIRYLSNVIRNAVIVEPSSTDIIDIGSTVLIHDGNSQRTFYIVGGHESDIIQGKISCYSPIGKALMGHKKGDSVLFQTPAGSKTYMIEEVTA